MEERKFARRVDEVSLRVLNSPWDEMIKGFDDLWVEVKTNFVDRDDWRLKEAQRRICESKIRFFPETAPKEPFDALWNEMLELGFSSLYLQASMAFFRANYLCVAQKGTDEEFQGATALIEDAIEGFRLSQKTELYESQKIVLRKLQERRAKKS